MATLKKVFMFCVTFIFHFVLHVFTSPNPKKDESEKKSGDFEYTYDQINTLPASDDPDSLIRVRK